MKFLSSFFCLTLLSFEITAQLNLQEIKKHQIKSVTEIHKTDSNVYSKKTVYNMYGHDSLIYHDGKQSFYSTVEMDNKNRIKNMIFYNARNDFQEEIHVFIYRSNKTYSIEIIAHGAGLIQTHTYDSKDQLLTSKDEYGDIVVYQYNKNGKIEKVFHNDKKGKKTLISTTKFDNNGRELYTELFGEDTLVISYEHNELGLITKIKVQSKTTENSLNREISYQFEF